MLTAPKIETRSEQPYVAIQMKVSMKDIPTLLPPLIPEVFNWLDKNNIAPAGPLFFQYLSMDKDNQLLVNVGVPVQKAVNGDGRIINGAFPAGTYAALTHIGNYNHLREAHMALEDWVEKNGYNDKRPTNEDGTKWGSRTESYLSDPQQEPNPEKWETEVSFLVKNQ